MLFFFDVTANKPGPSVCSKTSGKPTAKYDRLYESEDHRNCRLFVSMCEDTSRFASLARASCTRKREDPLGSKFRCGVYIPLWPLR